MKKMTEVVEQEVRLRGKRIHFLRAGSETGLEVLLLHGARFNCGTWRELGTIDLLAEQGFDVVAVDLPGHGKSEAVNLAPEVLLAELIPVLGLERPVIVSPSMSGRYALPYLVANPRSIAGFVPIAPAGVTEYAAALEPVEVPTWVFWGENDRVFPPAQAELLTNKIRGSRMTILPGASHPCYLDRPRQFHDVLVYFLASLTP